MFEGKADYYQSMHAIRILIDAVWRLYWEEFEIWASERDTKQCQDTTETALKTLLENTTGVTEQLESIRTCHKQIAVLQDQMLEFQKSIEGYPTAVFWLNVLEMSDILQRFIYHPWEGNWMGHRCKSARMLPFLTAAGHYKYVHKSLPLYLSEMKKLRETAPGVYNAQFKGAFVGRRPDGHYNGLSPDVPLEQTYNADANDGSEIDGITLNVAARTKWVYTKSVTAVVSAQLKSILHLNFASHDRQGCSRSVSSTEILIHRSSSMCRPTRRDC